MQAELHTLMSRVLHEARRPGGLSAGMDLELESTRLAALNTSQFREIAPEGYWESVLMGG
ncbi:hypothetical protein [Streptomyces sp. NPDC012746]|uniref:hypothetical protein n=1 Tax=Streptomyces sp. NPDC012746 TaxID=3364845 RepID=UPI003680AF42